MMVMKASIPPKTPEIINEKVELLESEINQKVKQKKVSKKAQVQTLAGLKRENPELFADEAWDHFRSEDSESLEPCSRLSILIAGDKVFQI